MKGYENDIQKLLVQGEMTKKELFADYELYKLDTQEWSKDKQKWGLGKQKEFVDIYSHWMCCNF